MRCKTFLALRGLCLSFVFLVSACNNNDNNHHYLNNVSGDWEFKGILTSNNCVAFSYLPLLTPFDLQLRLSQSGDTEVTGQKIGGLLWSEVPIEQARVKGAYNDDVIDLTAQFVNTQPVTSPPFIFPAGVTSSACVLQITGGVQNRLNSATVGFGYVKASVTKASSSGACDAWLQPIPCEMKITGNWRKMN